MRVDDLMTREVASVGDDASIGDALELLSTKGVRHVPIIDAEGALVGVLSDRDLRRVEGVVARSVGEPPEDAVGTRPDDILSAPATSLLSGPPVTVQSDLPVDDLIDRMVAERVSALPVTDAAGELVGIVSYVDVLRAARGRF